MHLYYSLPENVQYIINKINFSNVVLPCFHKDWWWHTVKCRANVGKYKMEKPGFLDAEIHGGGQFFSYGN